MKHISQEKIILGLKKKEIEHINSCKQCRQLYETFSIDVDEEIIELIDSKIRDKVFEKFKEMKALGKLSQPPEKDASILLPKSLLKYALGITISLAIILGTLFLLNIPKDQKSYFSLGSNIVEVVSGTRIDNVRLEIKEHNFFVYLPNFDKGKVSITPELGIKEITVVINQLEYRFQAKKLTIVVDKGKILIDNREVEPLPQRQHRSVIFLKSGEKLEGNLIKIKDDIIIFETDGKIKEFNKEDVQKVQYSH